ncbi:MAG TPA: YtxH domain-containing protein [Saprospiraceae bacterium]|nr:YtxH domain-containing protein [Saprospiraceae bacterium]
MNTGKTLLGLLAGLAIGAGIGILFAPGKGTETRKKIADKGKSSVGELEHKLSQLMESISQKIQSLKEESDLAVRNGKEHLNISRNETSSIKNQA